MKKIFAALAVTALSATGALAQDIDEAAVDPTITNQVAPGAGVGAGARVVAVWVQARVWVQVLAPAVWPQRVWVLRLLRVSQATAMMRPQPQQPQQPTKRRALPHGGDTELFDG